MPFIAALMSATVPRTVIVAVPSAPAWKARPAVPASVSVPLVTARVTSTRLAPESRSAIETWLPLPALKTSAASSFRVCATGTVFTGASFTAVTSIVIVFGVGSRSTPGAVPPLSCTWKVKLA
jgi:hypothetical protein